MNTCHTCRDAACPDHGRDQVGCEAWTSDGNGHVNEPNPAAALEARFRAIDESVRDLGTRLDELQGQFRSVIAAILAAARSDEG